jgi:hypothetical protein
MEEDLKIFRRGSQDPCAPKALSGLNCRLGVAAFAGLAVLLCSGATAPTGCAPSSGDQIGPSKGEVVGAAVGAGAAIVVVVVVLVEVEHSHHSVNGCVLTGPNGLELETSDSKTYALGGDAASVRVGDRVKLHGSKVRKTKDSSGDQVFRVASISKDYGPCKVSATVASSSGH